MTPLVRGSTARLTGSVAISEVARTVFAIDAPCVAVDDVFAAPLGDLDGDGLDDFSLASCAKPNDPAAPMQAHVFYGRADGFPPRVGLAAADATFAATTARASSLAGGDVDGDGIRDLIASDIGAHERNGAVEVFHGDGNRLVGTIEPATAVSYVGKPRRGTLCDFVPSGCIAREWVGYSVDVADHEALVL